MTTTTCETLTRWVAAAAGAVAGVLAPAVPYLIICTIAVFLDCYTAWCLGRRVAAAHPDKARPEAAKFHSHYFGRVIHTLLKVYGLIIFAYFIHVYISGGWGFDFCKVVAGAVCFWQLWSCLENESSCTDRRWARLAQRVLADKTARHFDLDLTGLAKDTAATDTPATTPTTDTKKQ